MTTTFEVPISVAARLDAKHKPIPAIRVRPDAILLSEIVVRVDDWLAYKAELKAQGLAVVYAGWPPGERCPVWNVVKALETK